MKKPFKHPRVAAERKKKMLENMTPARWIAVGHIAIVSLAGAGFWQDLVDVKTAAAISGGLVWVGSILQFVMTGKVPAATEPPVAS